MALWRLVVDDVAGDPMDGRQWIRRSLRKLRRALAKEGIHIRHETLRRLLRAYHILPRGNRKRLEGGEHPDRDRQFRIIQRWRRKFRARGWPVVSVDCKKKELIGLFKNPGKTWRQSPLDVNVYDFPRDALCKATPYGIYDVAQDAGHIFIGVDGESPDFAAAAVASWWATTGRRGYAGAPRLLVLADCGGGNAPYARRWKQQLQVRIADRFGVTVTVCHYPPGASKWNPIEHRLFSQISQTIAGTPLTSLEVLLSGIRHTRTTTGLHVRATLVRRRYPHHIRLTKTEVAELRIRNHRACPQWNYTITPRKKGK